MIKKVSRNKLRKKRHLRVRGKISGTDVRPRLSIYKSNKNISVQLIDDINGITLASATSLKMDLKNKANIEAAKLVGKEIAKQAKEKKIKEIVFDRSGYIYHGKIKALAETVRESGLKF